MTNARALFASSLLILSTNKRDSPLLRAFLFIIDVQGEVYPQSLGIPTVPYSELTNERCHGRYICYSPARRSILGETVPEDLSTARGRRPIACSAGVFWGAGESCLFMFVLL